MGRSKLPGRVYGSAVPGALTMSFCRYQSKHGRYVDASAAPQFMESYKSVKLAAVADSFGVSADFMDRELSEFIVAGRLPAKIDKVAGVVETNR